MINPWIIYFVLMLDDIKRMFHVAFFITLVIVILLGFLCLISGGEAIPRHTYRRLVKWLLPVSMVSFLFANLLPSPKVAAAMYVIPAIANNETVQREASELYQLAKRGLQELVPPPPKR